jgi:hypothetical protein
MPIKPIGISAEEWARYNEGSDRTLAEISRLPTPRCECGMCDGCKRRRAEAEEGLHNMLTRALQEDL